MNRKLMRTAFLLAIVVLACTSAMATYTNYAEDITAKQGVISPNTDTSNIDEYTFQDEQINVAPTDGLVKVLRTNQKVNTNEFVSRLIPIKNMSESQVRELRPIARAVCNIEGGHAEVVRDKVKKQYFVFVVCPPWMVDYVDSAFRALDQKWLNDTDDGSALAIYEAKYRDVSEIDALASTFAGGGGSRVVDGYRNSVNIVDEGAQIGGYLFAAKAVDVPSHEITVDAQFVELDIKNDLKLGLDYIAWKNGPGRNLFEFICANMDYAENFRGASSIFNPLLPAVAPPSNSGENLRWEVSSRQRYCSTNAWITSAYIDFLQTKGKARVIVQPTIQTRSGRLAAWTDSTPVVAIQDSGDYQKDLYAGETRVYGDPATVNPQDVRGDDGLPGPDFTPNTTNGGDLGAWDRYVNYVTSGRVGTFLVVKPYVGLETTEMHLLAAISNVNGVSPQGVPIIAKRAVSTYVSVKDGETTVIGGLKRDENVKQSSGMPFLSSMPVIGYLFGGEMKTSRQNDVVITLNSTTTVGAGSKMAMSDSMRYVTQQATGEAPLEVPSNPFGYDQYLLDPAK